MLSKCASPACSTQVDDDHGVMVVRKREVQNGSIHTGPSMQLERRGAYVDKKTAIVTEHRGHWLVAAWPVRTRVRSATYPAEANLLASRDRRSRR
jgi:hypothetical protein